MIDLVFAEMTLCAIGIIQSGIMENRLYLLGDSDAPVQLDERKLMQEWFEVNGLGSDGKLEDYLYIHPCKDYLRRTTYRKQSVDTLF